MTKAKICRQCRKSTPDFRSGMCQACYMTQRSKFGYRTSYVDATPVREHVEKLVANGMSMRQVALAAGLRPSSIHYICEGRPKQQIDPAKRVSGKTAAAILNVNREEYTVMSALSDAVNNLRDAANIAQLTMAGDSNDAEHEALLDLIEAAQSVIQSWAQK